MRFILITLLVSIFTLANNTYASVDRQIIQIEGIKSPQLNITWTFNYISKSAGLRCTTPHTFRMSGFRRSFNARTRRKKTKVLTVFTSTENSQFSFNQPNEIVEGPCRYKLSHFTYTVHNGEINMTSQEMNVLKTRAGSDGITNIACEILQISYRNTDLYNCSPSSYDFNDFDTIKSLYRFNFQHLD